MGGMVGGFFLVFFFSVVLLAVTKCGAADNVSCGQTANFFQTRVLDDRAIK